LYWLTELSGKIKEMRFGICGSIHVTKEMLVVFPSDRTLGVEGGNRLAYLLCILFYAQ
jgi:hypothetical protein